MKDLSVIAISLPLGFGTPCLAQQQSEGLTRDKSPPPANRAALAAAKARGVRLGGFSLPRDCWKLFRFYLLSFCLKAMVLLPDKSLIHNDPVPDWKVLRKFPGRLKANLRCVFSVF